MARRVDPEAYRRETPIFARLLADRGGRFPGTPEGEEELPEVVLTQEVPEDVQDAQKPVQGPVNDFLKRLSAVRDLRIPAVTPVQPQQEKDPEETQSMPVPLFVEPDEEEG